MHFGTQRVVARSHCRDQSSNDSIFSGNVTILSFAPATTISGVGGVGRNNPRFIGVRKVVIRLKKPALIVLSPVLLASQLVGCGMAGTLASEAGRSNQSGQGRTTAQSNEDAAAEGLLALNLGDDLLKESGEKMTVTVTDAKGATRTQTVVNSATSFQFRGLALGAAQIMVSVFAADGQLRFDGEGRAIVGSGGPATATITLRDSQTQGGLIIVVKKPGPKQNPVPVPAPIPIPANSLLQLDSRAWLVATLSVSKSVPSCFGYDLEINGNEVSFRECKDLSRPFQTVYEVKPEARPRLVDALNTILAVKSVTNVVPSLGALTYRIDVERSRCERSQFVSEAGGNGPLSFGISTFERAKDEILRIARTEGRVIREGDPSDLVRAAVCLPDRQDPAVAPSVAPVPPSMAIPQQK